MRDSLRHSRSRINSYRALASPSLIALSSKDPILTAFQLSWELRRLSFLEHEFKCEYQVRWQNVLHVTTRISVPRMRDSIITINRYLSALPDNRIFEYQIKVSELI